MTNIYVLKFKGSEEQHCYTSLSALYYAHGGYEKLSVKQDRVTRVIRESNGIYENKVFSIQRLTAYNKADIVAQKKETL